jgi:hypothetical protein
MEGKSNRVRVLLFVHGDLYQKYIVVFTCWTNVVAMISQS